MQNVGQHWSLEIFVYGQTVIMPVVFHFWGHGMKQRLSTKTIINFWISFCKRFRRNLAVYACGGSPMKMALIQTSVGGYLPRSRLDSQALRLQYNMHIILQIANRICINKVDRCQPDTSSMLILGHVHTPAKLISRLPKMCLIKHFKPNLERKVISILIWTAQKSVEYVHCGDEECTTKHATTRGSAVYSHS